jgi:hypothetical protein
VLKGVEDGRRPLALWAFLGVVRPQGLEELGMADPGENLGVHDHPFPYAHDYKFTMRSKSKVKRNDGDLGKEFMGSLTRPPFFAWKFRRSRSDDLEMAAF